MSNLIQLDQQDVYKANSKRFFCSKPFKWFEVHPSGASYLCCSSWIPYSIGFLQSQTVEELWNGPRARAIRRSILDGSFRHCTSLCPWLQTKSGPVQEVCDVTDPELRRIISTGLEVMERGPQFVNCAFDRSCNLACPSCRTTRIVETGRKSQILGFQTQLTREAFRKLEVLYITGSGDPFGSPYFKSWLKQLTAEQLPKLKAIHLHTNAQLWNSEVWEELSPKIRSFVKSAEISIDAARPATYAINRRGGRWDRLLRNLEFVSSLRRNGPLEYLKLHMVVQANNYSEMPEFVQMGKKFLADRVYFSRLTNWGTYTPEEFCDRAVHEPSHPKHQKLLEVINCDSLHDPIVNLGNLSEFKSSRATRTGEKWSDLRDLIETMM